MADVAIKGKPNASPAQAGDAVPADRGGVAGYVELGTAASAASASFDAAGAAAAAQAAAIAAAATDATTKANAAQAAAIAASQPLDSDLTAIAALTTTAYGRAFLALADAAAGRTALGLGTAAVEAAGAFETAGAIATHAALVSGTHGITAAAATVLDDATVSAMVDTLGGAAAEGTGALVRKTSPTIVTPTIASFANAAHDHDDAAGGGQLNASNVFSAGAVPLARGGLAADVSAYSGLVGISGGATYAAHRDAIASFPVYSASFPYCWSGGHGGAPFGAVIVASRLYAAQIVCPANVSVVRDFLMYVNTGVAATNARWGLYSDASGNPNALIANTDSGNQSTATSATLLTFTPGSTVTLLPGKQYWLCWHCDGAPTVSSLSPVTPVAGLDIPTGSASGHRGFYTSRALGAMPDPFPGGARTYQTSGLAPLMMAFMRFTS